MSWPDGCDECGGSGLANPAARASLSPLPPIPSADGGGQWTPDPEKPDHYTFGPLSAERTITLTAPHVATLPTGERVELPAGTVPREGTGGRAYEPAIIAMREPRPVCCKAAIECSALNWQPLVPSWQMTWGCVQHCPFCGAPLLTPGVDPVLADLTERVGLPREMAPSVEPDPWLRGLTITTANAIRSGIDRGLPAKAGVAAVIAAFQAGVDMAIPPKP